jgi:microcompartment protein CcmL/EutN
MATLRSFIFLDQLQPQTMCCLGSWIRGSLPRRHMAAQIIEVAPGLDIEALTDIALKQANVQGGVLVVERQFGYLEFHSRDIAAVKASAEAVLAAMGKSQADAMQPKVLASKTITRIDPGHAFLINRNKGGSMILAGETLFVLETEPAAYAILASNAAEKAANMKLVDCRIIGATGRLYLSGTESEVKAAAGAAEQALGL